MTMVTPAHVENSGQFTGSNQPVLAHFRSKTAEIHGAAIDLSLFKKPQARPEDGSIIDQGIKANREVVREQSRT